MTASEYVRCHNIEDDRKWRLPVSILFKRGGDVLMTYRGDEEERYAGCSGGDVNERSMYQV